MHERALKIAYNGKSWSFQNFLDKDKSVTIHHKDIKNSCNRNIQGTAKAFHNSTEWSFCRTTTELQLTNKNFFE